MLICGLAIPLVGKKTAIILADHYHSLLALKEAKFEELAQLKDVGEITAEKIINYFKDEDNLEDIARFNEYGLNFYTLKKVEHIADNYFKNKKFVLTGSLSVTRDEMTERLENLGAISSSSVTRKTDFVLVGKEPGSKLKKAEELNIKIFTEEEILPLILDAEKLSNN